MGDNGEQRSLVGCSPWGHRVVHDLVTEQQVILWMGLCSSGCVCLCVHVSVHLCISWVCVSTCVCPPTCICLCVSLCLYTAAPKGGATVSVRRKQDSLSDRHAL